MITPIMPQVKNIVFLMLENRSLDNVLGWLYSGVEREPAHRFPAGSAAAYDGLVAGRFANPAYSLGRIESYPVKPVPEGLGADQDRVPAYDPYEEMKCDTSWNGVLNQLYGDARTIPGLPVPELGPAKMLGFLQDYYAVGMGVTGWDGLDALWTYTPAQLPVINGLARQFAVSDRWFCSAPTQTNPNRAYSLCGTSLGRENNAYLAIERFDAPTVINCLAQAGKSWGLYYTDMWAASGRSYTEYTFPQISRAGGDAEVGGVDRFMARAAAGTLPAFTYLEPSWGYGKGSYFVQGTDYHPPTHATPGEQFLSAVYQAVRGGPQWAETLLIVTFDEHGGTYDHVAPPWGAINPDGRIGANGFKFDLLGPRVPTLLVSPFVRPSTVFRAPGGPFPFDHTSFIKTLLLWAGVDPGAVDLGGRVPRAPTFEGVLAADHVNAAQASIAARPVVATAVRAAPERGPVAINDLFEGVGFAAIKAILHSGDLDAIHAEIERYRRDPEGFERRLGIDAGLRE